MDPKKIQKKLPKTSRYWCYTLNNPTEECVKKLKKAFDGKILGYSIFQLEKAPTTGTLHYQGYIQCTRDRSLRYLKKHVSARASWTMCAEGNESAPSNIKYCSKSDSQVSPPVIWGKPFITKQGKRTDFNSISRMIVEEKLSNYQIYKLAPGFCLRYHKYIDSFRCWIIADKPKPDPKVIIHFGETRTGKTSHIHTKYHTDDIWVYSSPDNIWFDRYFGQKVVILDEYYGQFKLSYLLKLLDVHKFQVPFKGGFVNFVPEYIYFTSNKSPHKWYKNLDAYALCERIYKIVHFTKKDGIYKQEIIPKQDLDWSREADDLPDPYLD